MPITGSAGPGAAQVAGVSVITSTTATGTGGPVDADVVGAAEQILVDAAGSTLGAVVSGYLYPADDLYPAEDLFPLDAPINGTGGPQSDVNALGVLR